MKICNNIPALCGRSDAKEINFSTSLFFTSLYLYLQCVTAGTLLSTQTNIYWKFRTYNGRIQCVRFSFLSLTETFISCFRFAERFYYIADYQPFNISDIGIDQPGQLLSCELRFYFNFTFILNH